MKENVAGMSIPDTLIERMCKAENQQAGRIDKKLKNLHCQFFVSDNGGF